MSSVSRASSSRSARRLLEAMACGRSVVATRVGGAARVRPARRRRPRRPARRGRDRRRPRGRRGASLAEPGGARRGREPRRAPPGRADRGPSRAAPPPRSRRRALVRVGGGCGGAGCRSARRPLRAVARRLEVVAEVRSPLDDHRVRDPPEHRAERRDDQVDPEVGPLGADQRRAEAPRRVQRRAAERDQRDVRSRRASAGSRRAPCRARARSSSTGGSRDEDRRLDHLDARSPCPASCGRAWSSVATTVSSLNAISTTERGRDRAGELRDPVADQVVHRQPPVEEHRERDARVEVAARDLGERVEAGEQREAEGEPDRLRPPSARPCSRRDDRERADEDEREGAESLGEVLLHLPHVLALPPRCPRHGESCEPVG